EDPAEVSSISACHAMILPHGPPSAGRGRGVPRARALALRAAGASGAQGALPVPLGGGQGMDNRECAFRSDEGRPPPVTLVSHNASVITVATISSPSVATTSASGSLRRSRNAAPFASTSIF